MKKWKSFFTICLSLTLAFSTGAQAQENPPAPPTVAAQGAVLLNANTGEVLFGQNEHERYYPASITKLMTALLTIENCGLNDTVTFSATATTNLEAGSVSLKITEGDKLSVKDCLYGLLLKSANEIGNGLAEHIAGSNSKFADMMNARASALGCTGTHFANPHGLNDSNHYTTPYDMALIAREAFKNPTLRQITSTTSYQFPATKLAEERTITMGHKMIYPTDSRYYPGIVGGKTGYTSLAGNTLVTCAERDGITLIAVVMKSKSTHYADTKALLDYGFLKVKAGGSQSVSPEPGISKGPGGDAVTSPAGSGEGQEVSVSGPGQETAFGWKQDAAGWYYIKEDGSRASNEWLTIDNATYWFDSNQYMATGWRQYNNGAWYYFRSSGAMAVNHWVQDGDLWFYLGSDGVMLKNTVTPDGYQLDERGAWAA